jgi:hypothetical protein
MAKYPKKLRKEVCYFIPQMGRITYSKKLKKYAIPIEVVEKLKKKCIRKSKTVGNKLLKKLIKKWNKRIVLKACAKRQCKKKNK